MKTSLNRVLLSVLTLMAGWAGGWLLSTCTVRNEHASVPPAAIAAETQENEEPEGPAAVHETVVMLSELDPFEENWGHVRPLGNLRIGYELWSVALQFDPAHGTGEACEYIYQLPGQFDLFEAWIGVPPEYGEMAEVVLAADGKRLGSFRKLPRERAGFVWVPVQQATLFSITVKGGVERDPVCFMNARFVRGRAHPAQPQDLYAADGEKVFIERPGDYVVRLRQR